MGEALLPQASFRVCTSVTMISELHVKQLLTAFVFRPVYLNELKLVICFDKPQELFSGDPGNGHNSSSKKG